MTDRADIRRVLEAWRDGGMDELEVWRWAEAAREEAAPADELVRDLVDTLAALPFDFIIAADADVFLDALSNPVTETDLSVNLLWNHLDAINADERRFELRLHPFYGQFSDGMS